MHSYILESPEFGEGDYGRALFQGFLQENQAMKSAVDRTRVLCASGQLTRVCVL
jgi:hypothetical protein